MCEHVEVLEKVFLQGFGALSNQPRCLPTMTCVGDVGFMHGLLRSLWQLLSLAHYHQKQIGLCHMFAVFFWETCAHQ